MNLLEKKKIPNFFFSRSNEVTVCVEASRIIFVIIVSNTYQLLARVFNFLDPFFIRYRCTCSSHFTSFISIYWSLSCIFVLTNRQLIYKFYFESCFLRVNECDMKLV